MGDGPDAPADIVKYFRKLQEGYDCVLGPQGDTRGNQSRLEGELRDFSHHELDLRDREGVVDLVSGRPHLLLERPPQDEGTLPPHGRAGSRSMLSLWG